jgi:hypothetical protein
VQKTRCVATALALLHLKVSILPRETNVSTGNHR